MEFYESNEYTPNTFESDMMLSAASEEMIMNLINDQIDSIESYNNQDFLSSFIYNYKKTIEIFDEDETYLEVKNDEILAIRSMMENVCHKLNKRFEEIFSVSLCDIEYNMEEEMIDILYMVYRFFIVNIRTNYINLINNILYNDKYVKKLIANYKVDKSVSLNAYKKITDDKNTLIILTNLHSICKDIINNKLELEFEEYMSNMNGNIYTEYEKINEYYDNYKISGNFINLYKRKLNAYLLSEIENECRSNIINNIK